jgi:hypothetical protein
LSASPLKKLLITSTSLKKGVSRRITHKAVTAPIVKIIIHRGMTKELIAQGSKMPAVKKKSINTPIPCKIYFILEVMLFAPDVYKRHCI